MEQNREITVYSTLLLPQREFTVIFYDFNIFLAIIKQLIKLISTFTTNFTERKLFYDTMKACKVQTIKALSSLLLNRFFISGWHVSKTLSVMYDNKFFMYK